VISKEESETLFAGRSMPQLKGLGHYLMQNLLLCLSILPLFFCCPGARAQINQTGFNLQSIITELEKQWPDNKTINLVFHGHSVPAGYFKTPRVNTLEAYPYQVLKLLKAEYPYAVINIINTSIGGENSVSGQKRFKREVLIHRPDVLFIDYALNDRGVGLAKAHRAWSKMIMAARKQGIQVILLTPSPDQRVDMLEENNELAAHGEQIRKLAREYHLGLIDSYALFKNKLMAEGDLSGYMSQVNHPNEKGHTLIAEAIFRYFK
jgi:lysophospholipase L1-like esterase